MTSLVLDTSLKISQQPLTGRGGGLEGFAPPHKFTKNILRSITYTRIH